MDAVVNVMSQISTSVQQTTEVVVSVATAPTMRAASPVIVYLDTQEMESPVQVSTNTEGSFTCDCLPGYTGDGLSCTGKSSYVDVN